LSRSFRQAIVLVIAVGEIAVVAGLWIAGLWNLAPGGTIVLLLIALLILSLTVRSRLTRI